MATRITRIGALFNFLLLFFLCYTAVAFYFAILYCFDIRRPFCVIVTAIPQRTQASHLR
jgi:hypothetical protein